jgi:D-alanine-D-alanine ligase-like ATP-grasp enzyme
VKAITVRVHVSKLSKKRRTWQFSPVTRIKSSDKVYSRKQKYKNQEDYLK